jgi:hypothetical protein
VVRSRGEKRFPTLDLIALLWGVLCLLLLAGEKVMIDEIARETRLGWETLGEWIILYGFFTTQLFYCAYISCLIIGCSYLSKLQTA